MAGLQSQNISVASTRMGGASAVGPAGATSKDKSTCVFCKRRATPPASDPHAPVFAFFSLVDCRHYACQPCALVNCDNAGRYIECPQCHCVSRLAQSGRKRTSSEKRRDEDRVPIDDGVSSVGSRRSSRAGAAAAAGRPPRSALKSSGPHGSAGSTSSVLGPDGKPLKKKRASSVQFPANLDDSSASATPTPEAAEGTPRTSSPLTQDAVDALPLDPDMERKRRRELRAMKRQRAKAEEPSVGLYSLAAPAPASSSASASAAAGKKDRTRSAPPPALPKTILDPKETFPVPPPLKLHTIEEDEAKAAEAQESQQQPAQAADGTTNDDAVPEVAPTDTPQNEEEPKQKPEEQQLPTDQTADQVKEPTPSQPEKGEDEEKQEEEAAEAEAQAAQRQEAEAQLHACLLGEKDGREVIQQAEAHQRQSLAAVMEDEWFDHHASRPLQDEFEVSPRTPGGAYPGNTTTEISDQVSVTSDDESLRGLSGIRSSRSSRRPGRSAATSAVKPREATGTTGTATIGVSSTGVPAAEDGGISPVSDILPTAASLKDPAAAAASETPAATGDATAPSLDSAAPHTVKDASSTPIAETNAQPSHGATGNGSAPTATDATDAATSPIGPFREGEEEDDEERPGSGHRATDDPGEAPASLHAQGHTQKPSGQEGPVAEDEAGLLPSSSATVSGPSSESSSSMRRHKSKPRKGKDAAPRTAAASTAKPDELAQGPADGEDSPDVDHAPVGEEGTVTPSDAAFALGKGGVVEEKDDVNDDGESIAVDVPAAEEDGGVQTDSTPKPLPTGFTTAPTEDERADASVPGVRTDDTDAPHATNAVPAVDVDGAADTAGDGTAEGALGNPHEGSASTGAEDAEELAARAAYGELQRQQQEAQEEEQERERQQRQQAEEEGEAEAKAAAAAAAAEEQAARERQLAEEEAAFAAAMQALKSQTVDAEAQARRDIENQEASEAQWLLAAERMDRAAAAAEEADRLQQERFLQRQQRELDQLAFDAATLVERDEPLDRRDIQEAERRARALLQLEADVVAQAPVAAADSAARLRAASEKREAELEAERERARLLREFRQAVEEMTLDEEDDRYDVREQERHARRQLRNELSEALDKAALEERHRKLREAQEEQERARVSARPGPHPDEGDDREEEGEDTFQNASNDQGYGAADMTTASEAPTVGPADAATTQQPIRAHAPMMQRPPFATPSADNTFLNNATANDGSYTQQQPSPQQQQQQSMLRSQSRGGEGHHTPVSPWYDPELIRQMRERALAQEEEVLEAQARLREAERRLEEEARVRAKAEAQRAAAEEEAARVLAEAERRAEERIRMAREQAERELEEQLQSARRASERRAEHEAAMQALEADERSAVLEAKLQAAERALAEAQRRAEQEVQRARQEAADAAAAEAARLERQAREREAEFAEKKHAEAMLRLAEREKEREEAAERLREIEARADAAVRQAKEEARAAAEAAQARLEEMQARQQARAEEVREAQRAVQRAREDALDFASSRATSSRATPVPFDTAVAVASAARVATPTSAAAALQPQPPHPSRTPGRPSPGGSSSVNHGAAFRQSQMEQPLAQEHKSSPLPVRPPSATASRSGAATPPLAPAIALREPRGTTVALTENNEILTGQLIRVAIREAVQEILMAREHARTLRENANESVENSQRRFRHHQRERNQAEVDLVEAQSACSESYAAPQQSRQHHHQHPRHTHGSAQSTPTPQQDQSFDSGRPSSRYFDVSFDGRGYGAMDRGETAPEPSRPAHRALFPARQPQQQQQQYRQPYAAPYAGRPLPAPVPHGHPFYTSPSAGLADYGPMHQYYQDRHPTAAGPAAFRPAHGGFYPSADERYGYAYDKEAAAAYYTGVPPPQRPRPQPAYNPYDADGVEDDDMDTAQPPSRRSRTRADPNATDYRAPSGSQPSPQPVGQTDECARNDAGTSPITVFDAAAGAASGLMATPPYKAGVAKAAGTSPIVSAADTAADGATGAAHAAVNVSYEGAFVEGDESENDDSRQPTSAPEAAAQKHLPTDGSLFASPHKATGEGNAAESPEEPKTVKKAYEAFFVPFGDTSEPRRPKPPTPCNYVPGKKPFPSAAATPAHKPTNARTRGTSGGRGPSTGRRRAGNTSARKPVADPNERRRSMRERFAEKHQPRPRKSSPPQPHQPQRSARRAPDAWDPVLKAPHVHIHTNDVPVDAYDSLEDDETLRTPPPLPRSRARDAKDLGHGAGRSRDAYYYEPMAVPKASKPSVGPWERETFAEDKPTQRRAAYHDEVNIHRSTNYGRGTDPYADGEADDDVLWEPSYRARGPRPAPPPSGPEPRRDRRRERTDSHGDRYGASGPAAPAAAYFSSGMVSTPEMVRYGGNSSHPRRHHDLADGDRPAPSTGHPYAYMPPGTSRASGAPTLAELDRRLRQLRELDRRTGGTSSGAAPRRVSPGGRRAPTQAYDPSITVTLDLHGGRDRDSREHRTRSRSAGVRQSAAASPPWRTDLNSSPVRPPWNVRQPHSNVYMPPPVQRPVPF